MHVARIGEMRNECFSWKSWTEILPGISWIMDKDQSSGRNKHKAFWPVPFQNDFWKWISSRFGRTSCTGDRPDARPLPTLENTTQKDADKHPCLKRNSNNDLSVQAMKVYASDRVAIATSGKSTSDNRFCGAELLSASQEKTLLHRVRYK
jgi:hypothetical protein